MTSIKYSSGVSNYFHYDSMLRRYAMEDSDGLRYFSWDYSGLKLLTERDDQGEVTALYSHGYSAVPGIGSISTAQKFESDATYYQFPLMDHRGSVYRLTNDDGDVVFSAEYNAFGEVLDESNSGAANRLGYQSNWLTLKDSGNQLVLSPARLYSARLGRFLQKDFLFQMALLRQQGSYWNSIFFGKQKSIFGVDNYGLYGAFQENPYAYGDSSGTTITFNVEPIAGYEPDSQPELTTEHIKTLKQNLEKHTGYSLGINQDNELYIKGELETANTTSSTLRALIKHLIEGDFEIMAGNLSGSNFGLSLGEDHNTVKPTLINYERIEKTGYEALDYAIVFAHEAFHSAGVKSHHTEVNRKNCEALLGVLDLTNIIRMELGLGLVIATTYQFVEPNLKEISVVRGHEVESDEYLSRVFVGQERSLLSTMALEAVNYNDRVSVQEKFINKNIKQLVDKYKKILDLYSKRLRYNLSQNKNFFLKDKKNRTIKYCE